MKNGKTLLIIGIIIVILLVLAWVVSNSNKKKTQSAINNQQSSTPNPEITGRYISVASVVGPDKTETYNGKAVWLWAGLRTNCQTGYTKILSGANAGWCVLDAWSARSKPTKSAGEGRQWCCKEYDTNNNCTSWESRPDGSPCSTTASL